jgi:hypothetical protein
MDGWMDGCIAPNKSYCVIHASIFFIIIIIIFTLPAQASLWAA